MLTYVPQARPALLCGVTCGLNLSRGRHLPQPLLPTAPSGTNESEPDKLAPPTTGRTRVDFGIHDLVDLEIRGAAELQDRGVDRRPLRRQPANALLELSLG